jgi:acetylglutamate kinase
MQPSNKIVVIKIGGSTLGSQDTSLADVVALTGQGIQPVVVHGGGSTITQWMAKMGLRAEFVQGLRVTDAASLEVVAAVLAGLINKQLVATLLGMRGNAIGLSGADGAMLQGGIDRPELGFVAGKLRVDPRPIRTLVGAGYIPVVAPLALLESPGSEGGSQLLNVNADTAAGAIAVALGAARLVFLTDVDGVLDREGRLLPRVSSQQADNLMGTGVVKGGMIPKLEASLHAASHGTPSYMVNGTRPSALLDCINGTLTGTSVV